MQYAWREPIMVVRCGGGRNLRKNKYMCERLMVRLEEERAGGEALNEGPPSLRFARPRPCPLAALLPRRLPRSEPGCGRVWARGQH